MNVTINGKAEQLIREKLSEGRYPDAEAMILAALETLGEQQDENFAPGELEAAIAKGEKSLLRDGPVDATAFFSEMRQKSIERKRDGIY